MTKLPEIIIETSRLQIRTTTVEDAELYCRLWNDPRVMRFVGYPKGLQITKEEVEESIRRQDLSSVFGRYLSVQLVLNQEFIGECKMILPDELGVSRTDVKLLPHYWGNKFGVEIKQALVDYLFYHTDCLAVEGTPNVQNVASIKMQEAVGARRIGEQIYEFPREKADFTTPVQYYVYQVYRVDWIKQSKKA